LFFDNFLLRTDNGFARQVFETRGTPRSPAKSPGAKTGSHAKRLVKLKTGDIDMVRSSSNNGFNTAAMLVNIVLLSGVFAGMAVALTSMVA
jgi:hypothetical protein